MRVVVIGGTGHIGSYLVPRLVEAGHDVTVVGRGHRAPYFGHGAWTTVGEVTADREAEEPANAFGDRIAGLDPDIVIDLICFTQASAQQLVDGLRGRIQHFLHCGTIWVHGASTRVPTTEDGPRRPLTPYGKRKAEIEQYLHQQARTTGFPATVIHPGHITGRGWVPVNPAGNVNPAVFQRLADGEPVSLPDRGLTTLQHVHADDVARLFLAAIAHRAVSIGESFHAVSHEAVTMRGYAEATAAWFGRAARLDYLPWDRWKETVDDEDARVTEDHLRHSPHCGVGKAHRLLGHHPRYTGLEATQDALSWMTVDGTITSARPQE
ncbi:NAD-dependent epimerase/dehydratase family protein [Amycolatopsis minnesotensis]|uniref:NAD-dependent epimerase/dehydratase domain-containing protein n=1 Tax=Amycolatopsis minnesotensis TaxID=337894 RepID=A0ABP5E4U4_9PSEU